VSDDLERDPFTRRLRDSLARHAAEAPSGDLLAERIIHAADQQSAASREPPRRNWLTWALPAVAAAAVAGVVLAVVGIENYHSTSAPPATSQGGSPQPTSATVTPPSTATSGPPVNAADLTDIKVLDLTFVSDDEGWALASARCLLDYTKRCTALLHSTDGEHWTSMPGATFNVPGVSAGCSIESPNCVTNLRFANTDVGYAFGPSAFYMTADGGQTWRQQQGGAVALETFDQNVIRVTSTGTGCPMWCNVQVETSGIRSTTWMPVKLGGSIPGFGVELSRGARDSYLLFPGHIAGGETRATAVLYRSTDDGRNWTVSPEPCPQTTRENDGAAIAAAPDGRVSVLCTVRGTNRWYVATSTDHGADFTARPGVVPPAAAGNLLTGDPATVLIAANDGTALSTDGGATWQPVADVTGQVTFAGFESKQVGRLVTENRVIWTTRDGGRTWTAAAFR
jgi:hypothetical protein